MPKTIDQLIINSPYEEPREHWKYDRESRLFNRESGYPGVSGITKCLLEHWRDTEQRENHRLFFCQLEAIETLIWLTEGPPSERVGIEIPSDSGPFTRLCSKMATGRVAEP